MYDTVSPPSLILLTDHIQIYCMFVSERDSNVEFV